MNDPSLLSKIPSLHQGITNIKCYHGDTNFMFLKVFQFYSLKISKDYWQDNLKITLNCDQYLSWRCFRISILIYCAFEVFPFSPKDKGLCYMLNLCYVSMWRVPNKCQTTVSIGKIGCLEFKWHLPSLAFEYISCQELTSLIQPTAGIIQHAYLIK